MCNRLLTLLVLLTLMPPAHARTLVQYHYGDYPRWADSDFDDSSWPVASNGQFGFPPYPSDGLVWLRRVRRDKDEPRAVRRKGGLVVKGGMIRVSPGAGGGSFLAGFNDPLGCAVATSDLCVPPVQMTALLPSLVH